MAFYSILFSEQEEPAVALTAEAPSFFADLNLDQMVGGITREYQEFRLTPFYFTPLKRLEDILYRQEVVRDLEEAALLQSAKAFSEQMATMHRYLNLIKELDFKYHREGWFLEAVLVYVQALREFSRDLSHMHLRSRGLQAFREYLTDYLSSAEFLVLEEETRQLKTGLGEVQYCVIIKENWVRVRRYEGETDYSKEIEEVFSKFKQGEVKDYRAKLTIQSGMNHIEAQILECVAKLYPELFRQLDEYCVRHIDFLDAAIERFYQEIQFYLSYLDYILPIKQAGFSFCFPQMTLESKEVFARNSFDLVLAQKLISEHAPLVCNDFDLKDPERIIVVSGPNQGGKTTFARTFGQLHYLASLGLPVPGTSARLFLFDNIYTHFEKEEDIRNLRGKLQDDLVRIHQILEQATPRSIVILNEIFTSTTWQDALFLSEHILQRLLALDVLCVWVTFIDQLSSASPKTISMVSTVDAQDPTRRTYQIVRRPADGLAYALSIAEKYRLTYEKIKERIKP